MRDHPLEDAPEIIDNKDLMYMEGNTAHCILFLDANGSDGMLADDVTEMLREYDDNVSAIMPERRLFFPSSNDTVYTKVWLDKSFRIILQKAGISGNGKQAPRPYDFRHTFATHRIYQWMKEGKDIDAMIPYLSAYMGHAQISNTYYYIHLAPDVFKEMSGFDDNEFEKLIPEVSDDD